MSDTPMKRSTRKKDSAPRGVFRHSKTAWAIRFACGAGHVHEEKVGPLKSDAIRSHAARRQRVHQEPGWCPAVERRVKTLQVRHNQMVTLRAYGERWLESRGAELKPRTWDHYRQVLHDHIFPALGDVPLTHLTREMIRDLLTRKAKANLSRETLKNLVIPLRAMLNEALDDGKISTNPAVRLLKSSRGLTEKEARKVEALTQAELTLILTTANKHVPDWADFFRVLGWTGLRLGEACGLQWSDLDVQGGFIEVRRNTQYRKHQILVGAPKSGQARRVDVPRVLVDGLHARQGIQEAETALKGTLPSVWMFPAPTDSTKPVNPAFVRFKLWYKVLALAGLRSIPLHTLRHTHASLLLQQGESPQYVKMQLGHSSIQLTVDRYGHFIPGANRQAVERLAEATQQTDSSEDRQRVGR